MVEVIKTNFRKYYWDIYYGREEISIKSIEELPGDEIGVKLILQANMQNFSYFLYSVNGKKFRKSSTCDITVNFEDNAFHQETTVVVKTVSKGKKSSNSYTIKFKYYPKKFYEAHRMKNCPNIIIVESSPPLNFLSSSVEDWISYIPTEEEKKYALRKWGNLIRGINSEYQKAKVLAKSLMDDLWPHDGMPSDEMTKLSPFEQYERMVTGKDKGFCSQFASIFVCACNCLGISARRIHTEQIHSTSNKCRIQLGEMHGTTEIFDNGLNQWIWMDLRYYALGAYLGKEGPLNMVEFHLFLNQQERRKRLKLLIYDLETKSEKMLPLNKCPKRNFSCYEGWDKEFHYSKTKEKC
ncbi:transglutaminase domain-containing protein [bacterium]|nr:transglutaminase domain-containing protein [bacterium]